MCIFTCFKNRHLSQLSDYKSFTACLENGHDKELDFKSFGIVRSYSQAYTTGNQ